MTSRFASMRTFREGSVGLLLLLGLGVFGLIFLWLNRFTAARSSYKATVEFATAGGIQRGAPVRYRGVKVGNISRVRPGPNAVEVEIEIAQADLIIPRNALVEANQSGLINESIIDITPKSTLPPGAIIAKPLEKNCDSSLIVCNGSRLKGQIGISVDDLIRSSTDLATTYTNPKFYSNVNRVLETTTGAATSFAELSQDLQGLTKSLRQQLGTFTATANSVQRASNQLSVSTAKTVNQFGATANQANRLLSNLDNLVTTNRSSLVGALNNITETSNQLRVTVSSLSPAVSRLTQGQLLQNLETLSTNAAQASANLRDASKTLNNPNNVVLLQQTLDSARVTFENSQKITSDLDELTGDPAFRQNLRQLVNGLSGLVSSTQQIQQQTQVATTLDSVKAAVNQRNSVIKNPAPTQQAIMQPQEQVAGIVDSVTTAVNKPNAVIASPAPIQQPIFDEKSLGVYATTPSSATFESAGINPQPIPTPPTLKSSQEDLLKQLREYGKQREQLETGK